MPSSFVPVVTVGRTGKLNLDSEAGHLASGVVALAGGAILSMTSTTVQRWLADGSRDTTFNGTGAVALPRSTAGYPDYYGPTLLANGKILVSGANNTGAESSLVLMRLNADGSTDTSFGSAGTATSKVDPTTKMTVFSTNVLADGKILVLSNDWAKAADGSSGTNEANHVGIARYLANGTLDTSFGAKGFALDTANMLGSTATVQADGKIIVTGMLRTPDQFAVMRFNADGSRDTSFDFDGIITPFGVSGHAYASAVQADGKLVVVGGTNGLTVIRLNINGSLDTTFAENGVQVLGTITGSGRYVHINDDGSILVGASVNVSTGSYQPGVLRLRGDGELDTSFGKNGLALVAIPSSQTEEWKGMDVGADGRILLSGQTVGVKGGTVSPLLAVLDANGQLDTSVGKTATGTSNTSSYKQGYVDQFINPDLHIANPEQASYDGLTVTLARAGGANVVDHYTASNGASFVNGAVLVKGVNIGTAVETAGTLKLVFNTAAKPELVDIALQGIGYQNGGSVAEGQVITLNWNFSTSAGSKQTSTAITVHKNDMPYWIDAQLHRDSPDQSAAELRTELDGLLGKGHFIDLKFTADGSAAPFTEAEQATIRAALGQLSGVLDVQAGTSGTTVVVHHGPELAAGDSSVGQLTQWHGDIFLSSTPTQDSVLHSLSHLLGLQHGDLPAADAAISGAQGFDALDIAALQYLYGPSKTARTGDDTYQLSASSANFIWDGAGKDTISAAGLSGDVTLHLEVGQWDYIGAQGNTITAAGQVTINYGSTIENATGGNGNDKLTGSSIDNLLSGGAGNDVLTGLAGNDTLDGGAGIDTAAYAAKASSYVISRTDSGWSVKDSRGVEGTDQLSGIERLQFSDKFLALGDDAAQVYRLYQAAFNRTPDAGGLGFWLHAQEAGSSLRDIAAGFQGSAEYKQLYSGATEEAFVIQLYQNVLHRAPDAGGLAFWVQLLQNDMSRLDVLLGFSESKENIATLVGVTDAGMEYTPFH